jgi:hypothetical protein
MIRTTRSAIPFVLLLAAALPACDIRNPTENVDVRLNIRDAQVNLATLGAAQIVPGQATELTSVISGGGNVASLEAVQAIKLEPAFLTFRPASGDVAQAAGGVSGTVLVALRAGNRPLLSAVITIVNDKVTGIDPAIATLATAVEKIRQHGAAAAQQVPGAAGRLGDWQSLTAAQLLATLESILASPQSGLTLVVLPLSGNVTGSLQVSGFTVDATVTARR